MDTHVLHGRTHRVATKDRARMDMAISLTDAYAYAYAYGALVADGWYGCHARPLAARVARGAKNCRSQSPCGDTWHYMRMVIV